MSDHNHEDPLNSILNRNNEATEDNTSTNTPDLSPGLIDTITTNKLFQLFQNFIHSQEVLLKIQALQLYVVEAASQIIKVSLRQK